MFAAGSGAMGALKALLESGASMAARDRRSKGILDYAPPDSPVRAILEDRCCALPSHHCNHTRCHLPIRIKSWRRAEVSL